MVAAIAVAVFRNFGGISHLKTEIVHVTTMCAFFDEGTARTDVVFVDDASKNTELFLVLGYCIVRVGNLKFVIGRVVFDIELLDFVFQNLV